ncbi:MAG: hypothetical protein HUK08_08000 [Bacteroidaceae bacterium]|nr:hypothetical protein [Bacteroidaceae bacterium]
MKKVILPCFAVLVATTAMADSTDWLNFATGRDGTVVESVLFKNEGRLFFGDSEMTYSDSEGQKTIPYTGTYIFFSATPATAIEDITTAKEGITLTYSRDSQQIVATGTEAVSQIRIVSLQGSLLRTATNAKSVSTSGLEQTIVIATAISNGKTITKKFTIK